MDFSEYVSHITESLSVEYNKAIVKRLVQDIIDIYDGYFVSYNEYKHKMIKDNDSINNSYEYNKSNFTVYCVYIPKHIIIEEFVFNYIQYLSIKSIKGGEK